MVFLVPWREMRQGQGGGRERGRMNKTRIYLDNCCFNRPFDEQTQDRILLETEAKIKIQTMIKAKILDLVWSYMLDYENLVNPFEMKRDSIGRWKSLASVDIEETEGIIQHAKQMEQYGIDPKDALHIACAIEGKSNYFFTTDISLIKRSINIKDIIVCNPMQFFLLHNLEGEKE